MKLGWILVVFQVCFCTSIQAETLTIPDNEQQEINYWLPHQISQQDTLVKQAHQVFQRLLQNWHPARIEPKLFVIKSADGPWAASLADGHVLLSYAALTAIKKIEPEYHQDALAFVLAHELAHQANDDLWHQRFFRTQKKTRQLQVKFDSNNRRLKEMQADQQGLTMMTVVGFDPASITRNRGFFTEWLEINGRYDCPADNNNKICEFAEKRTANAKQKIRQIVQQKLWYELALYSFAIENYAQARIFLLAFAQDFPHWQIYNSIAVSYLLQVMDSSSEAESSEQSLNTSYHLLLNRLDLSRLEKAISQRGGNNQADLNRTQLLDKALHYLNKSEHLQTDNRETLYLLCINYLLNNNLPMAKGVLEGRLFPSHGKIAELYYLRALISEKENKFSSALNQLKQAEDQIKHQTGNNMHFAFAILKRKVIIKFKSGEKQSAEKELKNFVNQQNQNGNSLAFRWGLYQLGLSGAKARHNTQFPWSEMNNSQVKQTSQLWLQGEPFTHIQGDVYHQLLDKQKNPIFSWCDNPVCADFIGKDSARLLSKFGFPHRVQHIAGKDYLIYPHAGFVAMLGNKKIQQIFRYSVPG